MEVLAALAIFALAAIVLGGAYVNVLMGYEHAERATPVDADVQSCPGDSVPGAGFGESGRRG
ncbi:MAG: hypothetical protein J6386_10265 [Candidatus Synoicihabitans palmerolidicus]|nr:hypothetical protein [Candidatus Synoicihabitans palmerolidicus]